MLAARGAQVPVVTGVPRRRMLRGAMSGLGRRQALLLVAGTLLVVAVGGLAADRHLDSRGPDAAASSPNEASSGVPRMLTPALYGAVGDGRADDTEPLQAALRDLRPGDTLTLPAGHTYRHSDVLEVMTADVLLQGPGALLATNEERSSLQLKADRVTVRDLVLRIRSTTRRWDAPAQHRLLLSDHDGLVVDGVQVEGSAAAGVFVNGAQRFLVRDVRVLDTRADGIHITGGASHGVVERPLVERSGDDGVAVVSYGPDRATTSHITISEPTIRGVVRGRGVSVVGGEDVVYRDVDVTDTYAAGIYIATEGDPYFTRPTRRVRVLGASVVGSNRGTDIDHGAVLVSAAASAPVTDVLLRDVAVRDTGARASAQVGLRGDGDDLDAVRLDRFTLSGSGQPFRADMGGASWSAAHWVVNGRAVAEVENP